MQQGQGVSLIANLSLEGFNAGKGGGIDEHGQAQAQSWAFMFPKTRSEQDVGRCHRSDSLI